MNTYFDKAYAEPNETPSMKNIYKSTHWQDVRMDEQTRGDIKWNKAQTPMETGVVPRPAYASMFEFATPQEKNATMQEDRPPTVTTLAGKTIPVEQFTHKNMQPFFKGSVKQNMNVDSFASTLDRHTGRSEFFKPKTETKPFFQPAEYGAFVNGMPNRDEYYKEHTETPIKRSNDFPIPKINVGRGLAQGFTSAPSGGFQQANTLEYAKPRNVDELRTLNNPKLSYKLPFQGPKKSIVTDRGLIGAVEKNRPDTFYEQSEDQWIKTTGANSKPMERSVFVDRPTNRVETEQHTVVTNLKYLVNSITAPLLDVLKPSYKEFYTDSERIYGNMHVQIPSKPTVYDPVDHIMRTTIKELGIHDNTILNLKGINAGQMETDDQARSTTRETLPSDMDTGLTLRNVASHTYKTVVYDPDFVMKTTFREGTGSTDYYGSGGAVTEYRGPTEEAERNMRIDETRGTLLTAATRRSGSEGAKVNVSKDGIDMEIKKIASDDLSTRSTNNARPIQFEHAVVDVCDVTKTSAKVLEPNRLDPSLMNALKQNEYALPINPIGSV
jgi:hypothetical protein